MLKYKQMATIPGSNLSRQNKPQPELPWLNRLEAQHIKSPKGAISLTLSEPGLLLLSVNGNMDRHLAQDFLNLLNVLYDQLELSQSRALLLLDASSLESLSLTAQSMLFSSRGRGLNSPNLLSVHCVIPQPFLRGVIRVIQRMHPGNSQQMLTHQRLEEAKAFILPELRRQQDDLTGPELSEESFSSDHVQLSYFQPSPQTLLCCGEGLINASAAMHMLDVHARHFSVQRRHFGRAVLIIDASKMRHCTVEAYRLIRGEIGEASPKPGDVICVISAHWPRGVAKIVATLLTHLHYHLIVAGSLPEALQKIEHLQQHPSPKTTRSHIRLPWFGLRQRLREQEVEIARLKQEREQFLSQAGQLVGDILLHKQSEETLQIPTTELNGPYQELYESLYMLRHDYQAYLSTLQLEIDERIQAEHRAAELSQIKSRFLGSVSHELRTPLNAIIGFSHLVLMGKGGPLSSQQQRYLERVHDNSMHLLALINDVLDISKIESGTIDVKLETLPIRSFLNSVLEPLQLAASRKHIELKLEMDPQTPAEFESDPDRLRQIISNLVNNALKFTHTGSVTVRWRSSNTPGFPLALEVQDTGIGIAKEDQKKIFEAFTQVHKGPYAGTGLGLSICHSLCFVLGYQIELESAPAQGSLFRVLMS